MTPRRAALATVLCVVLIASTLGGGIPGATADHRGPAAPGQDGGQGGSGERGAKATEEDGRGEVRSSVHMDADRDRVWDALEARMAAVDPGDPNASERVGVTANGKRFTVIALWTHPVNESFVNRLKRQVGPFRVNAVWDLVNGFSANLTERQVRTLAERTDLVQLEPERRVTAMLPTARKWFGPDKARVDFTPTDGALDGSRDGSRGSYSSLDVVVCVIDTGVDASHVDLDEGQVIGWRDFVNGRSTPYDDDGHGTHVAGTVAGQGDGSSARRGVAPGAAIVGVKVLSPSGGTVTNVINGVEYCVANQRDLGVDIINMSLGVSGCWDGSSTLSQAVNDATDAGILPVVAAGNDGPGLCTVGDPGVATKALTVCNMGDVGEGGFFLWRTSSRGPTLDGRVKPDVCGPGYLISAPKANSGSRYVEFTGTSMAAPFTAGVAALMVEANPSLTPLDIKSTITGTAENWFTPGRDVDTGAGRLQAYDAIRAAGGYAGTGRKVPSHYALADTLGGNGAIDEWEVRKRSPNIPIAATLIIPDASASKDFDLFIVDSTGAILAGSESVTRHEQVTANPGRGVYHVIVYSFNGAGGYELDISLKGPDPALVRNE